MVMVDLIFMAVEQNYVQWNELCTKCSGFELVSVGDFNNDGFQIFK
jgi:hypothetical protein